jgi:hypothetical protein
MLLLLKLVLTVLVISKASVLNLAPVLSRFSLLSTVFCLVHFLFNKDLNAPCSIIRKTVTKLELGHQDMVKPSFTWLIWFNFCISIIQKSQLLKWILTILIQYCKWVHKTGIERSYENTDTITTDMYWR